jgi:hypothetical protein
LIRARACLGLVLPALLCACGSARAPHRPSAHGTPVLRAVYRDESHHLLVVLDRKAPHGDCTQPLLVDDATGAAHPLTPAEAAARMQHMQLSGAIEGTCP